MDEKDTDPDEMMCRLKEIERRQKLIAIMVALFGALWGVSKIFPFLVGPFIG